MKKNSKNLSIIDKDLKIQGTISFKGSLVIRGHVKGSIVGEKVIIAKKGELEGDTELISITIGGKFKGKVKTREIVLLSTGSCSGTIFCKKLSVESGAMLNAKVTYINAN